MPTRAGAKTLTKLVAPSPAASEPPSQNRKPENGRYLLQVDRQTKGSYATVEAAEAAGRVIKKGFPILQVTVYDPVECVARHVQAE
ncbi:hypothetical protein GJ689_11655 [Rhodoplanes serenus]|jgi:hypothetical protein|uniref:Uncharacterized protein n=1 Tax=Rhodoplanes serenus TaxID=200615 RepID=A0A447D1Q0_9BRAD|nr:hypothetical protein [Rhodoplanes serenus]MBI5111365.1 hypothetical protein [Rhodovulum sp.]MTW16860.1 hypothetical protein [Rhodoplanes serenus]VCU11446.1 hypothetical protein RHODGE_RHODGE_04659 [Rhodoplanes serenus]